MANKRNKEKILRHFGNWLENLSLESKDSLQAVALGFVELEKLKEGPISKDDQIWEKAERDISDINDINDLHCFLAEKKNLFLARYPVKFLYDQSITTWQLVHEVLEVAKQAGKEGPIAQYLVGAKLQLRFPDIPISNESYSTADDQLGRSGDFHVGDTIFHITVSPMPALYEKCRKNIDEGLQVYLIVPDRCLIGARQNAESVIPLKIMVTSIESFISQNIDELSSFARSLRRDELRQLLQIYNERVNATEIDKSMMIEIPRNLIQ